MHYITTFFFFFFVCMLFLNLDVLQFKDADNAEGLFSEH